MKSKYFGWTIVIILLGALLIYYCIAGVVGSQALFPEDAEKAMDGRAKILMETGEYAPGEIISLAMVNGEKEYFAAQRWDENIVLQPYNVINLDGETLLETDFFSWGEKKGKYLPGKGEKTWGLLDVETLKVFKTDFTTLTLHDSGDYFLGMRMDEDGKQQFAVAEPDGTVLYESDQRLNLTTEMGYVIEGVSWEGAGTSRIVDLESGQVVYEAGPGETVLDGAGGFWDVRYKGTARYAEIPEDDENAGEEGYIGKAGGVSMYQHGDTEETIMYHYILDENFEVALNGQIFSEVSLADGLVFAMGMEYAVLSNDRALPVLESSFGKHGRRMYVFNRQGSLTYEGGWQEQLCGNLGNTMVLWDEVGTEYVYVTFDQEGETERKKSGKAYCYPDFEDGFALCCEPRTVEVRAVASSSPASGKMAVNEWKWTYMTENMEPVMGFVFWEASLSENGYAVATGADGSYLIDLRSEEERGRV